MPARQFIDIPELAERLQVSRTTLKRWNRNGYMPHGIRVGPRLLRWKREIIDGWIDDGCPSRHEQVAEQVTT